MRKTKPFDDGELDISKTLGVDDFNLSLKEIDFVRCTYNTYVLLQEGGLNYKNLVRDFPYMGGVRFNYLEYYLEDENYIDLVFKETTSKYGYVIPFTFENDVFDSFYEFYPPLIGKVELKVKNYWRIMGSLLSIYTGEFLIIPESQDFLMIVENGDFVVSLHKNNPVFLPRSNIDVSELSDLYDKTLSLLLKMYPQ